MDNFLRKFAKVFCSIVAVLAILVIAICLMPDNKKEETAQTNDIRYLIQANEHGEKYPYTKDDLMVVCKKSAVWLQDIEGNEYALNGIAKSMLKDDKKYKGGTDLILKKGMSDLYTPTEAFEFCVRVD